MELFRRLGNIIPVLSILALLGAQTAPLQAAMIGNDTLIAQSQHELGKQQLLAELERAEVHDKLVAMGVDIEDAKERINQMSEQELASLAADFDEMPAGGTGIIGALLVVFVVLVITDMLGATNVFSFVHNINR